MSPLLLLLLVFFSAASLLLSPVSAYNCCVHKPDFGCCGASAGACNLFCCNCAGGCSSQCELTTCSLQDWLSCSSIVGSCASKCGDAGSSDCKACMGGQHGTCAKCVVSPDKVKAAEGSRKDDIEKDRVTFFNQIQGGKDIDLPTLTAYVKRERGLPGNGVDTNKRGTISFEEAFKSIDPDFDGDIGRGEFDSEKMQFKLGDFITGDQPPTTTTPDNGAATTAAPTPTPSPPPPSPSPEPETPPPAATAADTAPPAATQTQADETDSLQQILRGRRFRNRFGERVRIINLGDDDSRRRR